jgi:hypothetical protein
MLTGEAVSWSLKKQPIITLSTTEAKFVEVAAYVCQTLWMRRILEKLSHAQDGCTTMRCDNSSTIEFSKIHVMHGYSTLMCNFIFYVILLEMELLSLCIVVFKIE